MTKRYIYVYEPKIGLDGTIGDLCKSAIQHPNDYSDAALSKISELARECGFPEKEWRMPLLEIQNRKQLNP